MKEMIYTGTSTREILADEMIDGFRAVVMSLGSHPTAYVMIPDGHPRLVRGFNALDISVHGGVTYCEKGLPVVDEAGRHLWLGWDYAHWNDYQKCGRYIYKGRKHTTQEILEEAKSVIRQLQEVTPGGTMP